MTNTKPRGAAARSVAPEPANKNKTPKLGGGGGFEEWERKNASRLDSLGYDGGLQTHPVGIDQTDFRALETAAHRQGLRLTRVASEGADVFLVARLTFKFAFHDIDDLRDFLDQNGAAPSSAGALAAAKMADEKLIATAKARAALGGILLHELQGDDGWPEFVCTQGAWTRAFRTVGRVEAWLDMVEGKGR